MYILKQSLHFLSLCLEMARFVKITWPTPPNPTLHPLHTTDTGTYTYTQSYQLYISLIKTEAIFFIRSSRFSSAFG